MRDVAQNVAPTTFLDLPAPDGPVLSAGVDLVDTGRLADALDRYGERLRRRVFGDSPASADAFGVKESVIKAMGGLAAGGRLADIDVRPDGTVRLHGALAPWARTHQARLVGGAVGLPSGLMLTWALALPSGAGAR